MRRARGANPIYSIYLLAVVGLATLLNYYDRYLMSILVEPIKHGLRISDGQIGLITGVGFAVSYAIMGLPLARLADRYGRGRVLGVALAVWSVMTAVTGAVTSFAGMVAARLGVSIGEAGGQPSVQALIGAHFPAHRRGLALAVSGVCGGALGVSLALALGGIINDRYGWRTAFYGASVPGLILAAMILLTIREPVETAPAATRPLVPMPLPAALRTLLGRNAFMLLCIGVGIGTLGLYAQQAWTPAFLMRTYHLSAGEVGSRYAAVVGPTSIIAILLGGVVNDWLKRKDERWPIRIIAVCFGLCTPSGLVFFLVHDFNLAMLSAIVFTLAGFLWISPAYALVQGLAGAQLRAFAAAVFLLIINLIGGALGPAVVGLLSDRLGATWGEKGLMASLCIVVMSCALSVVPFLLANRTIRADLANAES